MAEITSSRISMASIVAGAVTGFTVNYALSSINTGIMMTAFHVEHGAPAGAGTFWTATILGILRCLIAFTAGGYVAGYFAPQLTLRESRMHGLVAFFLFGVITAFFMSTPGSITFRQTQNTAMSYIAPNTSTIRPNNAPGLVPARTPGAGTFYNVAFLTLVSGVAGYAGGGLAYQRRTRRAWNTEREEVSRAA